MIETSIKVSPDQVFSDLTGKITAKDGDTVAHLRGYHGKNWWQPMHSRRPVYRDGWLVFDTVDDRLIQGGVMDDLIGEKK